MSWTTVRGHRPVGVIYREREIGDPDSELGDTKQDCVCGERYDCEHVAALVID
jgi:SWIM zinc finger